LIYVDTNYWIYWLDSALPEHRYVSKIMDEAIESGVMTSYVTLLEVAHYLRTLPKSEFLRLMELIRSLSTLMLNELDAQIATVALELLPDYAQKGLGGRDCIILATMQLSGVKIIATHDKAFKGIKGVTIIDEIPARL